MTRFFRWIFLLIAFLSLIAALYYNKATSQPPAPRGSKGPTVTEGSSQKGIENKKSSGELNIKSRVVNKTEIPKQTPKNKKETSTAPNVSVIQIAADAYEAEVSAFGVATPQYELQLKSKLSGHVVSMSEQFNNGLRLNKGDVLLSLDNSDYKTAVAVAQSDVATARLNYLEEERAALQARKEWETMGLKGTPDSKLVLHGPQVLAAQSNLTMTREKLNKAQVDLGYSQLTVPFNALVVERLVTPGSYIQAGSEVAKIYSSDRIEISVALPVNEWSNLPSANELIDKKWPVVITSVEGTGKWLGYVSRVEQHLDETTRQRTLIIAIENPLDQAQALYPGTFVEANLQGKNVANLWKIPSSALSQRGEVWYVEKDKTISKVITNTIFADADSLYVAAPKFLASEPQQILINPLNSYLKGMAVTPVVTSKAGGSRDE